MKRSTGLLIYGLVLFILTTANTIAIPTVVKQPLDSMQWTIVIYMAILGYFGAGLCYFCYKQALKPQD